MTVIELPCKSVRVRGIFWVLKSMTARLISSILKSTLREFRSCLSIPNWSTIRDTSLLWASPSRAMKWVRNISSFCSCEVKFWPSTGREGMKNFRHLANDLMRKNLLFASHSRLISHFYLVSTIPDNPIKILSLFMGSCSYSHLHRHQHIHKDKIFHF